MAVPISQQKADQLRNTPGYGILPPIGAMVQFAQVTLTQVVLALLFLVGGTITIVEFQRAGVPEALANLARKTTDDAAKIPTVLFAGFGLLILAMFLGKD